MIMCGDRLHIKLHFEPKILDIGQEMNEKLQLYKGVMVYKGLVDHCNCELNILCRLSNILVLPNFVLGLKVQAELS